MATAENPQNEQTTNDPSATAEDAQSGEPTTTQPRDRENWAGGSARNLRVSAVPRGEVNNVDGRSAQSPLQGFGQMWQKTYRINLAGANVTPAEVISAWKENFPQFWPKGNRFYLPLTGIKPGEVAMLRGRAGGMPLSTGVLVLYADDESFTLMAPEGHVFAGWITFSAHEGEGCTVAQAQVLMRCSDPIYEFGARFMGGHRMENVFWQQTLTTLAAHFGVNGQPVSTEVVLVDPRVHWSSFGNVMRNSMIRTVLLSPMRIFRRG